MIHIYIGCCPTGKSDRAAEVLEHSIRSNTLADVRFYRIGNGTGTTGFSTVRWDLTKGMTGYAVYLDSDMLVLGDIQEVYDRREPGMWVGCEAKKSNHEEIFEASCVSVIDCTAMQPVSDLVGIKTAGLYVCKIPRVWNSMDLYEPDVTKLIHYTRQARQPWNPLAGKGRDIDHIWLAYENQFC